MTASASLVRRLTLAVLLLEFTAAVVLIATVGNHERHVQFSVFKANLRANANTLFGALQEADDRDGSIVLDLGSFSMPRKAVYCVSDAEGHVLGEQGRPPQLSTAPGTFKDGMVGREQYLFYVLTGDRVIDPGKPFAVNHHVRVTYGLPIGGVWHEIFEAVSFFSIATLVLLSMTALLLTWLIRRLLLPIRQLAAEADRIDSETWTFDPPADSRRLVELRPLVAAIERSLFRLQRSFERQRRFTSDAAHELKTDLAIVKSSFQLLKMKRRTVEEYDQGLSLGLADIVRLETTVQKMLTLARLEHASRGDGQICNFVEVLMEAIAQSRPLAELKHVVVEERVAQAESMVSMSREDALLLCSNVLGNAVQHSPAGKSVEMIARREGELVHLFVRDFGPGIATEDQPFLFDPFYRGDASRSRNTGGTGLGLSISKAICTRAGGTISIANHREGGAVVEIKLPILPAGKALDFSNV